jgi:hypothetical protein
MAASNSSGRYALPLTVPSSSWQHLTLLAAISPPPDSSFLLLAASNSSGSYALQLTVHSSLLLAASISSAISSLGLLPPPGSSPLLCQLLHHPDSFFFLIFTNQTAPSFSWQRPSFIGSNSLPLIQSLISWQLALFLVASILLFSFAIPQWQIFPLF